MAKYVCDFDQVKSIGEKMCTVATDVETAITNYDTQIETDLSSWNGTAKSSFQNACDTQVTLAKTDAEYINSLGEFITAAATSIESLESELSSLSI